MAELIVLIGPLGDFLNSAESSSLTAFELKLCFNEIEFYLTMNSPPHSNYITKYLLWGIFTPGRFGPDKVYCARGEPCD